MSKGWPKRIPQQPPTHPAKKSQDITGKGRKDRIGREQRNKGADFKSKLNSCAAVLLSGNVSSSEQGHEMTILVAKLYQHRGKAEIRGVCVFHRAGWCGNWHSSLLPVPQLCWSRVQNRLDRRH